MEKLLINKNNLLHIIKTLEECEKTKEDILKELNIKPSTFYKYMKLLKNAGFNVWQDKNNYEIINFKNKINFAKYELGVLGYLMFMSNVLLTNEKASQFNKVFEKITHLSSKEDYKKIIEYFNKYEKIILKNNYREKFEALNELINQNSEVKITTNKGEEFDFDLKNLNLDNPKFKNPKQEKQVININDVVKISNNQQTQDEEIKKNETIFEIYGNLSKTYLLRNDERIIDSTKNKIVVASSNQNKDELYRRLLRYDILCKIILPKSHVEEFKKMIEKSLDNLT